MSRFDQLTWTRRFLESAGSTIDSGQDITEQLRKAWWFNPLNTNSMRLSREGMSFAATHAKIHYYSHELTQAILPKTLLQLEKILEHPYYVTQPLKLIVYDERTSLTLTLYDNDLQTYLDNAQKQT